VWLIAVFQSKKDIFAFSTTVKVQNQQFKTHTMRNLFTLCCIFIFFQAQAQTNLSGIINHYSVVTEYDSCIGKLSVSDTTGFLPGKKILVYHTQGAIFNTTNNTTYGAISTMQTAGRYEYALIESRVADAVFLKYKLRYPVSSNAHIQLITVPMQPSRIP
jgi:hypothetical protein